MNKYGEVTENSHADDNPAKKAKYMEKNGFEILSTPPKDKSIHIIAIGSADIKGPNRSGDSFKK